MARLSEPFIMSSFGHKRSVTGIDTKVCSLANAAAREPRLDGGNEADC